MRWVSVTAMDGIQDVVDHFSVDLRSALKLITLVLACVQLGSCTRQSVDYVYVRFVGESLEVLEVGEPPMSYKRSSGDPIPIRYRINDGDTSIKVAIGDEGFVPDLRIKSNREIQEIDVGECAHVVALSSSEAAVVWPYWAPPEPSCISVGDKILLRIRLLDLTDPVVIEGEIAKSGAFYYYDHL